MGWIRHHGIVVTGTADSEFSRDRPYNIKRARKKAKELGLRVSKAVNATSNGYATILIAPDGSKEGWDTSNEFDRVRDEFVAWLRDNGQFDWFEYAHDVDNNKLEFTRSSAVEF